MRYPRKLTSLQHHRVYVLVPSSLISLLDRNKATGTFRKAMSSLLVGRVSHRWPPVNRLLYINLQAAISLELTMYTRLDPSTQSSACLSLEFWN